MFPYFSKKRPKNRRELKKAYRELAKQLHPDVEGGGNSEFQDLQTELEQIGEILDSGKRVDWTGTGDRSIVPVGRGGSVVPAPTREPEWYDEPEVEQWVRARMRPNADPSPSYVVERNFPWGCVSLLLVLGVGVLFAYSAVQGGYILPLLVVTLLTIAIAALMGALR